MSASHVVPFLQAEPPAAIARLWARLGGRLDIGVGPWRYHRLANCSAQWRGGAKYGSERTVYLPEDLVTILSEHVATQLDDAEPSQWLFTVDDEPMYDNAVTWRWPVTLRGLHPL